MLSRERSSLLARVCAAAHLANRCEKPLSLPLGCALSRAQTHHRADRRSPLRCEDGALPPCAAFCAPRRSAKATPCSHKGSPRAHVVHRRHMRPSPLPIAIMDARHRRNAAHHRND
ncbi:hypothetical protein Dimus_035973, partial [Dionaea muscipula]